MKNWEIWKIYYFNEELTQINYKKSCLKEVIKECNLEPDKSGLKHTEKTIRTFKVA